MHATFDPHHYTSHQAFIETMKAVVTNEEGRELLGLHKLDCKRHHYEQIFDECDLNHNRLISHNEFLLFVSHAHAKHGPEAAETTVFVIFGPRGPAYGCCAPAAWRIGSAMNVDTRTQG